MDYEAILDERLVYLKREFRDKFEVIGFLSKEMEKRGVVKEGFKRSVIEREKRFPTGLLLGDINVAIPHTEAEYTIKPSVSILTLKKPIEFSRMDEPNSSIPVHIVFLLAILEPKRYVEFLSKLTRSFSKKGFIKSIYDSQNVENVLEIMRQILKEEK